MNIRLFHTWVLVAATLLVAHPALAQPKKSTTKRVPTQISGWLLTIPRLPLVAAGDSVQLEIRKFAFSNTMWPKGDWVVVTCYPDKDGRFTATAQFPVDSTFIVRNFSSLRERSSIQMFVTVRVLDGQGQARVFPDGAKIILNGFGKLPWADGSQIDIKGWPDDLGFIRDTVQFPLNDITRTNFTLLAQGHGR